MIRIEGLNKSFGKLQVLKNFSISFPGSTVISVIGPNGSGKTTLIKCILGMVIPDSGQMEINGQSIQRNFQYRSAIGYMPQIGRYPDNMKIGQVFSMMKDIRNQHNEQLLDTELLEAYALNSMFDKSMRSLSGGTRQKVSAALAFLFNPDILILDEPTAGLDPLAAEILKNKIIRSRLAGKTILITSHIMNEVEELADDILYMFEGQVKFYKKLSDLKAESKEPSLGKALARFLKNEIPDNHDYTAATKS